MKKTEDCFLSVRNDYFKFLKKEKIFNKSKKAQIKVLKKIHIPMAFWIENKYKQERKPFNFRFFRRTRLWKNNRLQPF
jgi:hypothetical protein